MHRRPAHAAAGRRPAQPQTRHPGGRHRRRLTTSFSGPAGGPLGGPLGRLLPGGRHRLARQRTSRRCRAFPTIQCCWLDSWRCCWSRSRICPPGLYQHCHVPRACAPATGTVCVLCAGVAGGTTAQERCAAERKAGRLDGPTWGGEHGSGAGAGGCDNACCCRAWHCCCCFITEDLQLHMIGWPIGWPRFEQYADQLHF